MENQHLKVIALPKAMRSNATGARERAIISATVTGMGLGYPVRRHANFVASTAISLQDVEHLRVRLRETTNTRETGTITRDRR